MLYSPFYSLPYVILILYYIIVALIEFICVQTPMLKKTIRFVCISSFMFFFGLRGFIGWDWTNYYTLYNETPSLFNTNFKHYLANAFLEPGFIVYIAASKQVINNYHFFIFLSTAIDMLLLNIFLRRYTSRYALAFVVFVLMGGFFMDTDILRNAKSIFLFLISLKYLIERKPLPYFIINIIGITFHSSSIFYLPCYFFLARPISRQFHVILFIVGNIIFLLKIEYIKPIIIFITNVIGGKYAFLAGNYVANTNTKAYGISIGYIERVATALLILVYHTKLIKQSSNNIIFINAFFTYFFLFFYFAEVGVVGGRLGWLFSFSYWILWPALVYCFDIWSNRVIYITCISLYTLLKIYNLSNSILYKYDNELLGAKNYANRYMIFNKYSDQLLP